MVRLRTGTAILGASERKITRAQRDAAFAPFNVLLNTHERQVRAVLDMTGAIIATAQLTLESSDEIQQTDAEPHADETKAALDLSEPLDADEDPIDPSTGVDIDGQRTPSLHQEARHSAQEPMYGTASIWGDATASKIDQLPPQTDAGDRAAGKVEISMTPTTSLYGEIYDG